MIEKGKKCLRSVRDLMGDLITVTQFLVNMNYCVSSFEVINNHLKYKHYT